MNPKVKNIIIVLVVVIIGIVVYFMFFNNKQPTSLLTTQNGAGDLVATDISTGIDESSGVGKEFLDILLNIRDLKLDDKIFSNDAFLSLKDFTKTLTSLGNEGRSNPFAPIGTDNLGAEALTPLNGAEDIIPSSEPEVIVPGSTNNGGTAGGTVPAR